MQTQNHDRRWKGETPLPVPDGMQTMTRSEVAGRFGVDPRVVTRYAATGVLTKYVTESRGVRRSGTVVFDRAQVEHVVRLRREAAAAAAAASEPSPGPAAARNRRW